MTVNKVLSEWNRLDELTLSRLNDFFFGEPTLGTKPFGKRLKNDTRCSLM